MVELEACELLGDVMPPGCPGLGDVDADDMRYDDAGLYYCIEAAVSLMHSALLYSLTQS